MPALTVPVRPQRCVLVFIKGEQRAIGATALYGDQAIEKATVVGFNRKAKISGAGLKLSYPAHGTSEEYASCISSYVSLCLDTEIST